MVELLRIPKEAMRRVDSIEFSVRLANILDKKGFVYMGDIAQKEAEEFKYRTEDLGKISFKELSGILDELNLSFGMKFPGGPIDFSCFSDIKEISHTVWESKPNKEIDPTLVLFPRKTVEDIAVEVLKGIYSNPQILTEFVTKEWSANTAVLYASVAMQAAEALKEVLKNG